MRAKNLLRVNSSATKNTNFREYFFNDTLIGLYGGEELRKALFRTAGNLVDSLIEHITIRAELPQKCAPYDDDNINRGKKKVVKYVNWINLTWTSL
jgi:hypothetical protein